MRTLLTGEFTTAVDPLSDYYVKFEVQNGSGTWIDVGAALGSHWIVNVRYGETVDQPVGQATVVLVATVGTASLSPLLSTSALNVDDSSSYSPLLHIGRLARFSTATMPRGVALDVSKYREVFSGRIDNVDDPEVVDQPRQITVTMSDLGAWLMDMEIESDGVEYGTTPVGTALETVIQNVLTAVIPSTEPAVTLYKSSASNFAVTAYKLPQDKLLGALVALVLDSTGEDIRYRYDASHASRLTWFNPDRSRSSIDGTIPVESYVLSALGRSIANVRNAGRIPAPETPGSFVTSTDPTSIALYRRRFFQLPSSNLLTTDAQAQTIIDAAVNDLSDAPVEASALCPFLWFVQLYDRYTFPANNRQYDSDQTLCVVGYEHAIENGKGSTTLAVTGRVLGAYAAWLKRAGSPAVAGQNALHSFTFTDSADNTLRTFSWDRGALVDTVFVYAQVITVPVLVDPFDFSALLPVAILPAGTDSFEVEKPLDGQQLFLQFEPHGAAPGFAIGEAKRAVVEAAPSALAVKIRRTVTNATVDLEIQVTGGVSDFPITLDVYEGDPDSTPIVETTLTANATITKLDFAALGSRSLPQRALQHWWSKATNVAGRPVWDTAAADRDALPAGAVTTLDYRANPELVITIDDDTDQVRVTVPGGKTKTTTTPSGTNVVTYTVGDTLDDTTTESALIADETRSGYKVELKGGGTWLTIWGGSTNPASLHGRPSNPPTAKITTVKSADGSTEDVHVLVDSPVGEKVRVHYRDSTSTSAPIFGLCVGSGDSTPLFVDPLTDVGPSNYFANEDGTGSPSHKLSTLALTRDQTTHVAVQVEGKDSGVRSAWLPVDLSLKDVPFLESMSFVWDAATNNLRVRVKGGAKCASVFIEVSSSSSLTSPSTDSHALNPGDDYTATFSLSSSDTGKTWYARATPYNAVSLGGLAGVPMLAEARADQLGLGIKAVVVSGTITTADFQVDVTVSDPSTTAATMTLSHAQQGCTVARTGGGSDPLTTTGGTFRYTVTRSTTVDAGSGGVTFTVSATNRNDANVFISADATDQDAAPSLHVTVDASGNAIAVATGNNNTASWRWSASTSSMPSDGTVTGSGTVVNGRVVTVTVLTGVTIGQHVYVKFAPYTASGAGGTVGQIVSAEGDYQNKQQSKTLRLGHTFFAPQSSSSTISRGVNAVTNGTKTSNSIYAALIIPLGVTLTAWRIRANRSAGNGSVTADLWRYDSSGGTTNLGTLTHSTTGYQTISGSLSETTSGDAYIVLAVVDTTACTNANDNSLLYVEYDYTSPSYVVTL